MTSGAIRLVLADDHAMFRAGLRKLLEAAPGFAVIGESENGKATLQLVRELEPDVVLLDYAMPDMTGLDVLRELADTPTKIRIVLLTASIGQDETSQALQLGAAGVLMKTAATELLYECVRSVAAGQYWVGRDLVESLLDALNNARGTKGREVRPFGLTAREQEIARLVGKSYSNKEIATELGITEDTVKRHLSHIFDKTGRSNRVELAILVHDRGLLPE
jgi:two-component system, NarL family, nitrate/nitrite response regulator NarL